MARDDSLELFPPTASLSAPSAAGPADPGGGASAPLADRMRPRSLDEIVGQRALVAPRSALRSLDVYESGFGSGLFVKEHILARIDRKRWKGIQVGKLPVIDEPQDGIAEFPENWYHRGDAS